MLGRILNFLLAGKGLMRGISALLVALTLVPPFLPYRELLLQVSAIVGASGITRAAFRAALASFLERLSQKEDESAPE